MICLDFDGVIADSLDLWLTVFRQAAAYFEVDIDDDFHPFKSLRPLTFELLGYQLGVEPMAFADKMAQLALSKDQVAPLIPGMRRAISELSAIAPLAIVSSSRTEVICRFVERHYLQSFFAELCGSGDGRKKSEILKALKSQGADLMVGDAASDIDAAQVAGISSIGVTWGWQEAAMLTHAGVVVSSPEELVEAVRIKYKKK